MELRYYLSTLGRRKHLIIITALITGLVAFVATLWWIPTSYKAGLYFTISYRDDQPAPDYKYGNYYANMGAIEFARTMSGWTKNPKLTDEVYLRAGVNATEDINLLGKLLGPFATNRIERANITIELTSRTAQNAEKLIAALQTVLEEKLEAYNTISATRYKMTNASVSFETKDPDPATTVPLGIIAGLLLGILIAYLYEYFAGVVTTVAEAEELAGLEKSELIHRAANLDQYAFLASLLLTAKRPVILAGISFNPTRQTLRLARALGKRTDSGIVVDANLTKRTLHAYVKGHRKMKKGHTDVKSLPELQKAVYEVDGESFRMVPAGEGNTFNVSLLQSFVSSARTTVMLHTQLPENADLLVDLPSAVIFLFVQLGRSRADDVRKLASFYESRDTHLVIIQ